MAEQKLGQADKIFSLLKKESDLIWSNKLTNAQYEDTFEYILDLPIQLTSTEDERHFSTYGMLVLKQRSRLLNSEIHACVIYNSIVRIIFNY